MCGIFGFSLNRSLDDADIEMGKKGTMMLIHRGPDHIGYWEDKEKGIFIGHTRLSILDLGARNNQPMSFEKTVLAYNGEIYNYQDIRNDLISKNIKFTSTGDTEVLLHAWRMWGEKCLDRFDGMFAFSIVHNNELFLATDYFGEKPLYWIETDKGVYFSSEPAPLIKLLDIKPSFTQDDVAQFLSLGFLPAPATGFTKLNRAHAAMVMRIANGKIVHKRQYWSPPSYEIRKGRVHPLTERELDEINNCLIKSIKTRLHADVPLAIFLSSGLDSSLIAAIASKDLKMSPMTLTVRFADNEVNDESEQAAMIAEYLKLPHSIINSDEDQSRCSLKHMCDLLGEANDVLTIASIFQMSKSAARRVKVAITGLGADEVFCGYHRYYYFYKFRNFFWLPYMARYAVALLLDIICPDKCTVIKDLMQSSRKERYLTIKSTPFFKWIKKLEGYDSITSTFINDASTPMEIRAQYYDLTNTLPYSYIPATERGSMRASLEIRTPYLNRQLLSVITSLDHRALFSYGHKNVQQRLLRRYLPHSLINMVKQGFNYPTGIMINDEVAMPRLSPHLSDPCVRSAWRNREKDGWNRLCVRMKMLEIFLGNSIINGE